MTVPPPSAFAPALEEHALHHEAPTSTSMAANPPPQPLPLMASPHLISEELLYQALEKTSTAAHRERRTAPGTTGTAIGRDTSEPIPTILSDTTTLQGLYVLHERVFASALAIVTEGTERIVRLTAENSRRIVYAVGSHYLLPPMYCSCSAFLYTVLRKGTALKCKHIVALEIALTIEEQQRRWKDRGNRPQCTPDDPGLGVTPQLARPSPATTHQGMDPTGDDGEGHLHAAHLQQAIAHLVHSRLILDRTITEAEFIEVVST